MAGYMDKETIKQIILREQELIPTFSLVERDFNFEPTMCQVLVGIRRAGKSFLLYQNIRQLIRERHSMEEMLFINFEDERIAGITSGELHLILDAYRELFAFKPFIFLDEIQNVDGWEHFARRLADEKYKVIITGSNAKMLSRDIASTLGGRYMLQEVFPFSFSEYLRYRNVSLKPHWELSPQRADIVRMMDSYLHGGGLAESFDIRDKRGWLQSLYERILLSDIVVRYKIKNENSLRLLVRKLADSVMQPTGIKRLQNILQGDGTKIARTTISSYLAYLHDAYLVFSISNFSDSLSDRTSIQKHYFYDNGLLSLFIMNPDTKLLENLVALHLYKKYGDSLQYYRRNVEVDFVVADAKLLVQVSWSISNEETYRREASALSKVAAYFGARKAYIITFNEEQSLTVGDTIIEVVPIYRLLLDSAVL